MIEACSKNKQCILHRVMRFNAMRNTSSLEKLCTYDVWAPQMLLLDLKMQMPFSLQFDFVQTQATPLIKQLA